MTTTTTQAAVAYTRVANTVGYVRISKDREGRALGVDRQAEDCTRLAGILGLSLTEVVSENDRSASTYAMKPRPLWADLVERVRRGEVTHIVAATLSRLTRSMVEREELLALRHLGLSVTTAAGQRIYPTMSASEVHMIRMLGANDSAESDYISERTKRSFQQSAQRGTPHGPIAYGWSRHRARGGAVVDTIDKAQASVLREVAQRMIDSESTSSIVRDLNARGIPAPRGGAWSPTILRKLMLRERNVARRVHQGEVVGPAAWEPLYGDDVHAAVLAHLLDPARVSSHRSSGVHLLSGLLTCGRCGSRRMWAVHNAQQAIGYQCKDCFGIRRRQEPVDLYVVEAVCARLARPDALDWLAQDQGALVDARAHLATLEGQAAEAADAWSAKRISMAQLARMNDTLLPQIAAATAAVEAARPVPAAVRNLAGLGSVEAVREAWALLTHDARRAVIAELLTITVLPTSKRKFDPEAIRLDWRTEVA